MSSMLEAQVPVLTEDAVREWFQSSLPIDDFVGKRVLVLVPDSTRTAPLPLLWDAPFQRLSPHTRALDVIVALGTHPPMSDGQICKLLGISKPFGRNGQRLEHWRPDNGLILPGTIYVGSHHPSGFDSRYYGPVPIGELKRMEKLL